MRYFDILCIIFFSKYLESVTVDNKVGVSLDAIYFFIIFLVTGFYSSFIVNYRIMECIDLNYKFGSKK